MTVVIDVSLEVGVNNKEMENESDEEVSFNPQRYTAPITSIARLFLVFLDAVREAKMAKVREFVSKEPIKWKTIREENVVDYSEVLYVCLQFFFRKSGIAIPLLFS